MINNPFQILSNGKVKRISEDFYLRTLYNPKRKKLTVGYISKSNILLHKDGHSIYFSTKQLPAILDLLVADKQKVKR